jgi:leucyl-tRNA---protein transferase
MARLLRQFTESPRACSYLSDREAALEYRVMLDVSPKELEAMLLRGWRRFGPCYFRPACAGCGECVSIRLPTEGLKLNQSQRRAKKSCAGLEVRISAPRVDRERLSLYRKWHSFREETRGWGGSPLDSESYALEFAFPHPAARELAYYDLVEGRRRLVGVGICDETPKAWSAIYFFYDPDYQKRSLGTFNILYQLEHARGRGIPYVYLGYRVAGCRSMRYKATFQPHELLFGLPSATEEPGWIPGGPLPAEGGEAEG